MSDLSCQKILLKIHYQMTGTAKFPIAILNFAASPSGMPLPTRCLLLGPDTHGYLSWGVHVKRPNSQIPYDVSSFSSPCCKRRQDAFQRIQNATIKTV